MRPSDLMLNFGRPVAYYPGLAKPLGGVNAALFFCQIFYWQDKASSDLGVYKTSEEIEEETGMSYREQVTARKALKDRGILIENNKRLEHKIYYKIDIDTLDRVVSGDFANCGKRISGSDESAFREDTKAHFDHTEITTQITSENKNTLSSASQKDEPLDDEKVINTWNEIAKQRNFKGCRIITDTVRKNITKIYAFHRKEKKSKKQDPLSVTEFTCAYLTHGFEKWAGEFYSGQTGYRADLEYATRKAIFEKVYSEL